MRPFFEIDFTGVETSKRMSKGTHIVSITKAELKDSSTGSKMLSVTYRNDNGEFANDNFVIVPQSLWKLKLFLEAVFNTPLTGKINFDPKNILNKRLVIKTDEEEYITANGTPATTTRVLPEYEPIDVSGIINTPNPAVPFTVPSPSVTPVAPPGSPVIPNVTSTPNIPVQNVSTSQQNVEVPSTPVTNRPKLPWEQ